ncbi:MAG: AAA family ATPase [Thermodesulfobacteriota bacterium]
MNYFDILNFNREPFSNSPDPDIFFESDQHVGCLHKLELAIRMQRGLNTVIGKVGTGKTTLCRQLITRFKEDKNTLAHLILDPYFSSEEEFLRYVAALFRIPVEEDYASQWQMKEYIKQYLFRKGVDEGKTVLLIIDEGQKISRPCLEILREFLNYETNNAKLLQIVIFAQEEFEQVLGNNANLADRINMNYYLAPLGFQDTRAMIRYRLAMASADGQGEKLFSRLALYIVYRKSGGYPRRIINICHKIILAMIIQNKKKAGFPLTLSAAGRLPPFSKARPAALYSAAGLIIAAVLFFLFTTPFPKFGSDAYSTSPSQSTRKKISTAVPTPAASRSHEKKDAASPARHSENENTSTPPKILGTIRVGSRDTLGAMIRKIYGPYSFNPGNMEKVLAVNQEIEDPDFLAVGEEIAFPDLGLPSIPENRWWIRVSGSKQLESAYKNYNQLDRDLPDLLLIPELKNSDWDFIIVLEESFSQKKQAVDVLESLPVKIKKTATLVKKL